jgi:hypothetical protein
MSDFDTNQDMIMANEMPNEIENDLFVATMVQLVDKLDQEGYGALALEDTIFTSTVKSPAVESEGDRLNPSTMTQIQDNQETQASEQLWKAEFLSTFDQVCTLTKNGMLIL